MLNQHFWKVFLKKVCFTSESGHGRICIKLTQAPSTKTQSLMDTQQQVNLKDHTKHLFTLVYNFVDYEYVFLPDDSDSLLLLGAQARMDRQPCLYEELSSIPQVSA